MLRLSDEGELAAASSREIPFNYTSADDRQAIAFLLGPTLCAFWTSFAAPALRAAPPVTSCASLATC
jgi:hypothetical protein